MLKNSHFSFITSQATDRLKSSIINFSDVLWFGWVRFGFCVMGKLGLALSNLVFGSAGRVRPFPKRNNKATEKIDTAAEWS